MCSWRWLLTGKKFIWIHVDRLSYSEIQVRTGLPFVQAYGLETLFAKYGVDLQFWAHEHSYERLWPVYNNTVRWSVRLELKSMKFVVVDLQWYKRSLHRSWCSITHYDWISGRKFLFQFFFFFLSLSINNWFRVVMNAMILSVFLSHGLLFAVMIMVIHVWIFITLHISTSNKFPMIRYDSAQRYRTTIINFSFCISGWKSHWYSLVD